MGLFKKIFKGGSGKAHLNFGDRRKQRKANRFKRRETRKAARAERRETRKANRETRRSARRLSRQELIKNLAPGLSQLGGALLTKALGEGTVQSTGSGGGGTTGGGGDSGWRDTATGQPVPDDTKVNITPDDEMKHEDILDTDPELGKLPYEKLGDDRGSKPKKAFIERLYGW